MLSTSADDLPVHVFVNLLKRNGTLIIGQRSEVKLEPRPRLCCWLHVIACVCHKCASLYEYNRTGRPQGRIDAINTASFPEGMCR